MGILSSIFGERRKVRCKVYTTDGYSAIVKVDVKMIGFGDFSDDIKEYTKDAFFVETGKVAKRVEILGYA
jgi:hypothetical protein